MDKKVQKVKRHLDRWFKMLKVSGIEMYLGYLKDNEIEQLSDYFEVKEKSNKYYRFELRKEL
ncbi:hypothetical protein [Candidatus Infernicultor aquiphilus]